MIIRNLNSHRRYQDWIYNAFRIRDISQFGISSWDHIWGNGINHWRAFQYVVMLQFFLISKNKGLSITKAMLWLSAVIFLSLYKGLSIWSIKGGACWQSGKFLCCHRVICTSQQWTALKEFHLYWLDCCTSVCLSVDFAARR